jgi:hypothetical protein
VAEFDSFLSSSATFIATVCGPLYLINKGAGVMGGMSSQGKPGDRPLGGPLEAHDDGRQDEHKE